MNKLFVTIAVGIMMFSGCTKAQMISDLPEDINKGTVPPPVTETTAKRGVAFSTNGYRWGQSVANLKANWYYTWGVNAVDSYGAPSGVEFVPMIWGAANNTQANIDIINKMYNEGKCYYLLGFNEPDLKEESNMSVNEALKQWKFICENINPNIKLVSPAPSYPTRQWLKDFMAGVQQMGLRVDYVAVHIYAERGTSIYKSQIEEVYKLFGRKVWITEFAPRDESADKNLTMQWVRDNFIEPVVTSYETMPEVFRYVWFSGSATMAGLVASRLVDDNGVPTILGEYYKTISPNENVVAPK